MIPVKRKSTRKEKLLKLSTEQQHFVDRALEGHNILVDACIGSGKTTSIQYLCDEIKDKSILYLTYNKLLKLDAKKKIKSKNTMVTNYHGFACLMLIKNNKQFSYSDSIQQFLEAKLLIPHFDILIIDEYQDIDQELADLLLYVKESNPSMQLIAVGDMQQKIYDKTSLNAKEFIDSFLGNYLELEFTTCFRLSREFAEMLGRIWKKKIVGVNDECKIELMNLKKAEKFIADKDPSEILCLGARYGDMTKFLNVLEDKYPKTFNKKTVYATVKISGAASTEPHPDSAIFTTFDSCKGMEKPYCIVFDWTYDYWITRLNKPNQSYEILKNIFCVAASRGKKNIIFVSDEDELLCEDDIENSSEADNIEDTILIDEMFDYKYREDIDNAYKLLKIEIDEKLLKDKTELNLKETDELIDLLPCISLYQKVSYFKNYNIDDEIKNYLRANPEFETFYDENKKISTDRKILLKIFIETHHNRYIKQVAMPFVDTKEKDLLHKRLASIFSKNEKVQVDTEIEFKNKNGEVIFTAIGLANVVKDDVVYCINYSHSLSETDCLSCACYVYGLGLKKGMVWNTYDNTIYEISIPDSKKFMNAVVKTITKGNIKKFY